MTATSEAISRLAASFLPAVTRTLDRIAKLAQSEAIQNMRFRGGANSALAKATRIVHTGFASRAVIADKPYAGYLEYGNNQQGAYIYPVRAKCLHFTVDGQEVFVKKARTHGPIAFMEPAQRKVEGLIPQIIHQELGKWSQ